MWYLITFEDSDFVRLKIEQGDTSYKFEGEEENKPIFAITEEEKTYELEVLDDTPDTYRLRELNKLNPKRFILLNHASVILEWKEGIESLQTDLKQIFNPKDKYVIIPVSEISASNFLQVQYLNQLMESR